MASGERRTNRRDAEKRRVRRGLIKGKDETAMTPRTPRNEELKIKGQEHVILNEVKNLVLYSDPR
jgi:hypothetical protein